MTDHETGKHCGAVIDPTLALGLGMIGIGVAESEAASMPIILPEGYHFDDKVDDSDLEQLFTKVGGNWVYDADTAIQTRARYEAHGITMRRVGVRGDDGQLIGFGSLAHIGNQGELGDFAVHPDHRRKHIGKAIIDERLRLAESAGLTSLYVDVLMKTNTLSSYYLEKGFTKTTDADLILGPEPISMQSIIEANSGTPFTTGDFKDINQMAYKLQMLLNDDFLDSISDSESNAILKRKS